MAKGLTRAAIVTAALDVLDEGGIDAVTVRAVATRLGVKAPALYWHVSGKQELLDEMGTEIQRRVIAALAVREPGQDWRDDLAAYAHVLRAEYLAHRDGARTFSGTRLTDPEVLRAQEPGLRRWVDEGHELRDATDAAALVTAFVVGFVIEEQERTQGDPGRYAAAEREARVGPSAPLVQQAGQALFGDPDDRFERQLRLVLAGLSTLP